MDKEKEVLIKGGRRVALSLLDGHSLESLFSSILVQSSPVFYVAISPEVKTLTLNAAMLSTLGYRLDEVQGRDYLETFVPAEDHQALAGVFRQLVAGRQPSLNENRVLTRDGKALWVEWHGTPVLNEAGETAFLFGVGLDISQRKAAEHEQLQLRRRLQRAQKLESLGLLAAGVAHDFNNLLTGILNNVGMVALRLPPQSPARHYLDQIGLAARRAAEITGQMLSYAGKGRLEPRRLDLRQLIQQLAPLLEAQIPRGSSLRFELGDAPEVYGDASQLQQVILNLLTNAADAIQPQTGTITLTARAALADRQLLDRLPLDDGLPEGSYACLQVTDTGRGLDRELLERVFDPFFTTKPTGRGLGLALVLGIVRAHWGTILLDSIPNEGTTVTVLLPAAEVVDQQGILELEKGEHPSAEGERRGGAEKSPLKKIGSVPPDTILVIDDEPIARNVAQKMLVRLNYRVLLAGDGRQGAEIFSRERGRIAAVLLDVSMPQMGGNDTLIALRNLDAGVQVILTSGFSELDAMQQAGYPQNTGYLQKPYRSKQLAIAIEQMLGQQPPQTR